MSDLMEVFRPGERYGTLDSAGRILVWEVQPDGLVKLQPTADHHHGPQWQGDTRYAGTVPRDDGPAR